MATTTPLPPDPQSGGILRAALLTVLALCLSGIVLWWSIPAAELADKSSAYVDLHVHAAGIGAGDSGAFINDAMATSYKFGIYLWAMGVTREEIDAQGDVVVLRKLSQQIGASRRVGKAVVLAMDGVIDADGVLNRARTQIYVPNDFLMRTLPQFDNLLFGASVNPYRADALERLDAVKAAGAVLVKWIPNIMHIDPADMAIEPYYRKLVALNLPLLTHTGQERSFADADDTLGDPARLELPLSLGVTVIAAHIASTGDNDGEPNYERIMPLLQRYPNLYTDISSLTQINKLGYLSDALARLDLLPRLLNGSDWPLQFTPLVSPLYHLDQISVRQAKAIGRIDNRWDRDVALKEAMGVPAEVFERSATLLGLD